MTVPSILVDARSIDQHLDEVKQAVATAPFIGIDVETEDSRRHAGLTARCGYDPKTGKKSKGKPLVFDHRRTTLCGMSLYSDNMKSAYYFNVGHADVENRVSHDVLRSVLECKQNSSWWVAHNAPFEITTLHNTMNFALDPQIICTLQQAVSAYGPQETSVTRWQTADAGGIAKLVPALIQASITGLTDPKKMEMSPELSELVYKIIAKESSSEFSYNGLMASLAYGYSLKKVVKSFFDYQMTTFAECLGDAAHMGQKTGAEVVAYGADDAYWAFRLFHHLLGYMNAKGGQPLLDCFFEQENPMAVVYSEIARGGLRVNTGAITARRESERVGMADTLRAMKPAVRALLPFKPEFDERLLKYDKWYMDNGAKYRQQVVDFANSNDPADPFEQCAQVRGPVSNAWASDLGRPEPKGINLSHYMPVRTLMYDLIGTKALISQGKVQSDGEARGKIRDRMEKLGNEPAVQVLTSLNKISGVEQTMKLYLTPYNQLMDPETDRLYPTVSSMLATRRMACSEPNGTQLTKRGESTYVRGFFLADHDDQVLLSCDWSGIELVEIGEFSGDPEFIKAFGQLPHEDLHSGAAADILAVDCPGLTEASLKDMRNHAKWETFAERYSCIENMSRLAHNLNGQPFVDLGVAYKYWRTEVGKGANFNYWYSGYLATIGERMGWSPEKTSTATQRYANRFPVAEAWRQDLIAEVQREGFITLPDGHQYVRREAMPEWAIEWQTKFIGTNVPSGLENFCHVVNWMGRKIARRAGNQTVNAMIQGTCATIAKRSILAIDRKAKACGWTEREFRFMLSIHDELLFSVHRSIVPEAIALVRGTMIDHPDIFKLCTLDASPAIGLTFEAWKPKNVRLGQVELYEPPAEIVGETLAGKRLNDDGVRGVVDWLFEMKEAA
jgi:DNA polymerase I-like protein with 3'-5' exonuclease and polymerase domains